MAISTPTIYSKLGSLNTGKASTATVLAKRAGAAAHKKQAVKKKAKEQAARQAAKAATRKSAPKKGPSTSSVPQGRHAKSGPNAQPVGRHAQGNVNTGPPKKTMPAATPAAKKQAPSSSGSPFKPGPSPTRHSARAGKGTLYPGRYTPKPQNREGPH